MASTSVVTAGLVGVIPDSFSDVGSGSSQNTTPPSDTFTFGSEEHRKFLKKTSFHYYNFCHPSHKPSVQIANSD